MMPAPSDMISLVTGFDLRRSFQSRLLASSLIGMCACSSGPKPIPLPAIKVTKSWLPGLPQEGARILEPGYTVSAKGVYQVKMIAWLLSAELPGEFEPVFERTKLILATEGKRPVLPSSTLVERGKLALGKKAREVRSWIEIGGTRNASRILSTTGILPKGLTLEFRVEEDSPEKPADPIRRALSFCLSRDSSDQLTVSILREETTPTEHELAGMTDQELLVLDRAPVPGKSPICVIWPANLPRLKQLWVAVYLEVAPEVDRDLDKSLAECLASLKESARQARSKVVAINDQDVRGIDLANALESLERVDKRRAMLVNQAKKTGADLALDLGLSAEDGLLAAYVLQLIPKLRSRKPEELVPKELGWILEKQAWLQLLLHLENDPIPPEILALAIRHAGEVARNAGLLRELVQGASGLAELQRAILNENRSTLISNMPSPRIRAYLWLESHGQDLGDYRPMASDAERRKAYLALVRKWEPEASKK